MAQAASAKKQIIERIGEATNILVTVSKNPSVDELSAALGLTIFLNKLGKHATAIFSGTVPPAITFLKPDKTFETTTDSLRDFIIALDKEKADHLRYKVVDDAVVKIFITPYKTTITEKDLEFSHGDYNVDLVVALNVAKNDELDEALAAHGKILHDATVVTVTSGDTKSDLGTIDWRDGTVSGVSEMAAELASELKTAKAVLDEQIATALLTGIVASTDRFSNNMTSSRVMTIAAELMASGANQQLIATKLTEAAEAPAEPSAPVAPEKPAEPANDSLKIDRSKKKDTKEAATDEAPTETDGSIGMMQISHAPQGDLDEVTRKTHEDLQDDAARIAEKLVAQTERKQETAVPSSADGAAAEAPTPQEVTEDLKQVTDALTQEPDRPSIGGTLNATTEQAAEDKRRETEADRNRVILKHGTPAANDEPVIGPPPLNATMSAQSDEPASVDIFAAPSLPTVQTALQDDAASDAIAAPNDTTGAPTGMPTAPTLADIEAEATKAAADKAGMTPFAPPAPGLPPMPDFSQLPPLPPAPTGVDATALPPLPTAMPTVQTPPADFNPSQFQIPGQS